MSRGKRIALIAAGSLAGLALVLLAAGIAIVRTDWFRNLVREKIVSAVETATGGKAEIGSFSFDWTHLRAVVRGFTIHGLEPAGAAPLFRANLVEVDLKLTSPFKGTVDIARLLVDTPQANIIVNADGSTNVPNPRVPHTGNKTGLETIVDLAVGRFDLVRGGITFADRKYDFSASGNDLKAQLAFDPLKTSYTGEVDANGLHWKAGGNTPLSVDLKLPVTLEKDRISVRNAQLSTPGSSITITGSMDHLVAPRASAQVEATVALDEVRRAAGVELPLDTAHAPQVIQATVAASMDDSGVQVRNARIELGRSTVTASGTSPNDVQFDASLDLGELGRLLRVAAQPKGTARIAGNAVLPVNREYRVTANLTAHDVAMRGGSIHMAGIEVQSGVTADPRRIELGGLRVAALGGSFAGSAELAEMARFQLQGKLGHFDIEQIARLFRPGGLGYSGAISGDVRAAGNIKESADVTARAALRISPGVRGVPVSGVLDVDYDGRAGMVTMGRSYLALPHTRVDLSGSIGRQIQVSAVSRDLRDLQPLGLTGVSLNGGGTASVHGTVSGRLDAPRVTARLEAANFAVEGRPFTRLGAEVDASPSGATVRDGTLARGPLEAEVSGTVGLRAWKPEKNQALRVDATMRNGDLADVLALTGQSSVAASGALSADAHITGTVGDPRGAAQINVTHGILNGQHFDSLAARVAMREGEVDLPELAWVAGPSRLDGNATYRHGAGDLEHGVLEAHVASSQIQLAQFQSLVKDRPGLRGTVALNGGVTGNIRPAANGSTFEVTSLTANVSARGLQMEGRSLGDFTAAANTSGSTLNYNVNSDFAGSSIRVNGQSLLTGKHETTASATIANLPIDRVLAIAGRRDLDLRGTLGGTAQVSGTLDEPQAKVNVNVTKGTAWQEPFDRLQATVNYSNRSIEVPQFRVEAGPSAIELTAAFTHPAGDLQDGQVRFQVHSGQLQLARLHSVQQYKPGVAGTVDLTADGAATLRRNAAPLLSSLTAHVAGKSMALGKQAAGEFAADVQTRGRELAFDLNSDFAGSKIRGNGTVELSGDYPVNARMDFSGVTYSGLGGWIGGPANGTFDASMDGQVSLNGPVTRVDALRGSMQLTKLEAHSVEPASRRKPRVTFELRNSGAVSAVLERGVVTIQSARINGPFTNLTVSGTASLKSPRALNLRAVGDVKLEVLEALSPDIFSAGGVTLNAGISGTMETPVINGRLQLQGASFDMLDWPNGLSDANGAIVFNGTEATIQNLTGSVGGGKVTLAGSVAYGGPAMQFRIQADAQRVHLEYPESVTTNLSARLNVAGTTSRSLVSGTVRILDVALHTRADVGSMLTSAAAPPSSPTVSSGLLAGMRFDVQVRTAPDVQFRTSLTENLEANADLTLRGTPDHPGMLGRIVVTQGDVIFFGTKYHVAQGTVSFYNPQKIDPQLNVDLETTAQGITVTLSLSGPVDQMRLSYRSEPPLEFNEIVSLLASGKTPTSDPVLAAHAPQQQQQNIGQMGASTLLGQAVANPVSGRLQRLFGVSKLQIDPQVSGLTNSPTATLTLQQQITKELTFTYIQDVTQSNSQIIRIEWAIDSHWSAVAARDFNGEFNLDFFYKKRFW